MNAALVATLHDPRGELLRPVEDQAFALSWYEAVYVVATTTTNAAVVEALRHRGVTVEIGPTGAPGTSRRQAVHMAADNDYEQVHYCDLDRWLHWAERFPDELAGLRERITRARTRPWFVCIGRTPRALATHPDVQRLAEGATNRALALVIGRPIDATAGSCWVSREGAEIIATHSTESTMATDLEWPALIWRRAPGRLASFRVEGLEFESAAFATRAIAEAGSEQAWLERTYGAPAMWHARLQLAADSVKALDRVLAGGR